MAGALVGYLFFTADGRRFRGRLEPLIEDAARELVHFRATLEKATGVATEGWKLLNDTINQASPQMGRFADPHQTTPF
jgi:hypothetical protein